MPTKVSRWLFEPVTLPVSSEISNLIGRQIEYLTDDGETWEVVTLIGFNTHTLRASAFTMQGQYVEVLPLPETDFGKRWYTENQPPTPIKVFHASRLREVTGVETTPPIKVIDA